METSKSQHFRANLAASLDNTSGEFRNSYFSYEAFNNLDKKYPQYFDENESIQKEFASLKQENYIPPFEPECKKDREILQELSKKIRYPAMSNFFAWLGFEISMFSKNPRFGYKVAAKPFTKTSPKNFFGNLTWATKDKLPDFKKERDPNERIVYFDLNKTAENEEACDKHVAIQENRRQSLIFGIAYSIELQNILDDLNILCESTGFYEHYKIRTDSEWGKLDTAELKKYWKDGKRFLNPRLKALKEQIPNFSNRDYEILHYYLKKKKLQRTGELFKIWYELPSKQLNQIDLSDCKTEEEEYKIIEKFFEELKEEYSKQKNTHVLYYAAELYKNNFNSVKTSEITRKIIDDYDDLYRTIGMPLHKKTRRLVIDIDNYPEKPALETLANVIKELNIKKKNILFVERNHRAGGIHAFFATQDYITEENAKNIEANLKAKGIEVECWKFYAGSSFLRYPCSKEYEPISLGTNFLKTLEFKKTADIFLEKYLITSPKEYPITSKEFFKALLPPIKEVEKKVEDKNVFWKKDIACYGKLVYSLNEKKEHKIDYDFPLFKDGHRWEQFKYEIPLLKTHFHYTVEEIAKNFKSRAGTSKDLNYWTVEEIAENIRSFYNLVKPFNEVSSANIGNLCRPISFRTSLANISGSEEILSKIFLRNKVVSNTLWKDFKQEYTNTYKIGKRLFKSDKKARFNALFLTWMTFEIYGKCIHTLQNPKVCRYLKFQEFSGQQFPKAYFEKALKAFTCAIFDDKSPLPLAKEIRINLQEDYKDFLEELKELNKDNKEHFILSDSLVSYFKKNIYLEIFKMKKILLEKVLKLEVIERNNNLTHHKNSCKSFNLNTYNRVLSSFSNFLSHLSRSSYYKIEIKKDNFVLKNAENAEFINNIWEFFRTKLHINPKNLDILSYAGRLVGITDLDSKFMRETKYFLGLLKNYKFRLNSSFIKNLPFISFLKTLKNKYLSLYQHLNLNLRAIYKESKNMDIREYLLSLLSIKLGPPDLKLLSS